MQSGELALLHERDAQQPRLLQRQRLTHEVSPSLLLRGLHLLLPLLLLEQVAVWPYVYRHSQTQVARLQLAAVAWDVGWAQVQIELHLAQCGARIAAVSATETVAGT